MSQDTPGQRPTVLFLQATSGFGGSKRALMNLIDALPAGHDVLVACAAPGWVTEQLDLRGVSHVILPFPKWRQLFGPLKVRSAIRKHWLPALASRRIKCVYANELPSAGHAVTLAKDLHCPSVVHLHGVYSVGKARKHLLPRADRIVACSSEGREAFKADPHLYGATRVVFNGLSDSQFVAMEPRETTRAKLGLAPGRIAIGNVGKLCERKNQRLLLRAAGMLKRRGIGPFTVFLAGASEPEYEVALRRDIEHLDLAEEVCLLGHVEPIGGFLSAMDVIVHCARAEGLAFAMVEAMRAGKAVVATAVEGTRDAIPSDDYGLVVPSEDESALAEAVARLAANPDLRTATGKRARDRAATEFSMETFGRRIGEVLNDVEAVGEPHRGL